MGLIVNRALLRFLQVVRIACAKCSYGDFSNPLGSPGSCLLLCFAGSNVERQTQELYLHSHTDGE